MTTPTPEPNSKSPETLEALQRFHDEVARVALDTAVKHLDQSARCAQQRVDIETKARR